MSCHATTNLYKLTPSTPCTKSKRSSEHSGITLRRQILNSTPRCNQLFKSTRKTLWIGTGGSTHEHKRRRETPQRTNIQVGSNIRLSRRRLRHPLCLQRRRIQILHNRLSQHLRRRRRNGHRHELLGNTTHKIITKRPINTSTTPKSVKSP